MATIQLRRGTAAAWTSANPTMALGEVGLETDTRLAKIGDGSTAWNSLAYAFNGALDADLTAIAALASTGVLVRTASNTWNHRTITGTANKITVTDGDGVAGNPTLTIPDTPTLVTPTIASLTNAQHTHQNAAGGGTLDAAAIAAGTMATARLGSGTADQYAALFGSQAWLPVVKFEAFTVLYTDFSGFSGTAGTKNLKTSLPAGTMILATGVLKNGFMTAGMGTSVDCDIGTVTDSDLFMAATPCGATSGADHLQPTAMPKIVGSGQDIVFRLFNASFNLNTMTGGDLTVLIAYAVP